METAWRLPNLARKRANAGQTLIQQKYGLTAVGEIMKTRISHLIARGLEES
jgi:hypothetical protein